MRHLLRSRRSRSLAALAGLLSALLVVVPGAVAPASAAGMGVYPLLTCVSVDAEQQVTAQWGYVSTNAGTVSIAIGPSNVFSPPPGFREQVTTFEPGFHPAAFSTTFRADQTPTITWTLDGHQASASSSDERCPTGGSFTSDPVLSGRPTAGRTVRVLHDFAPGTIEYAESVVWTRGCDTDQPEQVGQGRTYDVTEADAGQRLSATVTYDEVGGGGSVSASTPCDADAVAGIVPAPATVASVVGVPRLGGTLALSGGTWSGTDPIAETVTWQSCSTVSCADVGEGPTYVAAADDVGRTLRAVVEASSPWGEDRVVTAPTEVVRTGGVRATPTVVRLAARPGRVGRPATVEVVNDAVAEVGLTGFAVVGPDRRRFAVLGGSCLDDGAVASDAACTVRVRLEPRRAGRYHATLRIEATTGQTLAVTLRGVSP